MYKTHPKKYIITAADSTNTNGISLWYIPAIVHNPLPIKLRNILAGKILTEVSPIPIRQSIVPSHFTKIIFSFLLQFAFVECTKTQI